MDWKSQLLEYLPRSSSVLLGLAAVLVAYSIAFGCYHLYLSPIAKFPGPRLAAVSLYYDFYYDSIQPGQFTFKIRELHDRYGPIIRISPYELHIDDVDYFDELCGSATRRRDKWYWSSRQFGNETSGFGTPDERLHRMRRMPINPFFSRQSIQKFSPVIESTLDKVAEELEKHRDADKPCNVTHLFNALTTDVVTAYAFGKSYGILDAPNYTSDLYDAICELLASSNIVKHWPWFGQAMEKMPRWLAEVVAPAFIGVHRIRDRVLEQLAAIKGGQDDNEKYFSRRSIFHELIASDTLPPQEKETRRLLDEGQAVVAAGAITTTHFLMCAVFYILESPDIHRALKKELMESIPDPAEMPKWADLEKLPMLTAIVLETFRITYCITSRVTRIAPNETLRFKDWMIPPGTPVSMTIPLMHDRHFDGDPKVFNVSRWLDPEFRAQNERYLFNFGRGTRVCIGQNLARAEIYMTMARLFRLFDMELYQTSRSDVEVKRAYLAPLGAKGTKGVQVLVH